MYTERLIEEHGVKDCGICGIGLLECDRERFEGLKDQDLLYTLLTKNLDGSLNARVIGSIVEYLFAPDSPEAIVKKMSDPDVKIISLTITKNGYYFVEASGEFDLNNPMIQHDLKDPKIPQTVYWYLARALRIRKETAAKGCSILSCDNIKGNGDLTKRMLFGFIEKADPSLIPWVKENVSFPNSMVDRITPHTFKEDQEILSDKFKINDKVPVVCESFIQWVIEDNFITGRPDWEKVGAQFVTDVVPYENTKLRLLNAGHTILGILGALHGYTTIDEVARDEDFECFLRSYMTEEVIPGLNVLEGFDIKAYENNLVSRFKNKYIKDKITRICMRSSTKFPEFILPTIVAQLANGKVIERAALIVAAWCKYNEGVDEKGCQYEVTDLKKDQLLKATYESKNNPIEFLRMEDIFGKLSNNEIFTKVFVEKLKEVRSKPIKECIKIMNSSC